MLCYATVTVVNNRKDGKIQDNFLLKLCLYIFMSIVEFFFDKGYFRLHDWNLFAELIKISLAFFKYAIVSFKCCLTEARA